MDVSSTQSSIDVNNFLQVLSGSSWGLTASTKVIDNLFTCALHLQENLAPELASTYPGVDFSKSVDLLLENIIKNQNLNESITLYAINKYINLFSCENLSIVLENLMSEFELREHLFTLIEQSPNVDLDFSKMNRLLNDLDCSNFESKMVNAIKFESCVLLNALVHCSTLAGPVLINKLISCLESQADLRLWFTLFKKENAETVVKLCMQHNSLLNAVLVFFDKVADEIESTYDEDLNIKYSHVNLDFEDFVKIFQLFVDEKSIREEIRQYLNGKTMLDKNWCFWIDLKSCIEY